MKKEPNQVKITETDNGLRVDIVGFKLDDVFSGCCRPMACLCRSDKDECCQPEKSNQES